MRGPADIIIVSEAPVLGRGVPQSQIHTPYADDAGKIVTKTIALARGNDPAFAKLRVTSTYTVMCSGADPNKDTQDRCGNFLRGGLPLSKTPVVVAMGLAAVKALGIKATKLGDLQHRILPNIELNGQKLTVLVTLSSKQLVAMPGMYENFRNDINRAFELTRQDQVEAVPLSELTKDYLFPKTLAEVEEVCQTIIGYSGNANKPAEDWLIAADTETNTKFPHRKKLKVLAVSFAWDIGKAAAIPLFHKDCPYDPALATKYVQEVLLSKKPKTFHNGKFDTKVFKRYGWDVNNWIWDSMLAEHALSEDKKGQYGLKALTTVYYPAFAGYADVLHALLSADESDSWLDTLHRQEARKLAQKKKKTEDGGFENVPLDRLLPYAAIDTDITRRLSIAQVHRMGVEEKVLAEKRRLLTRDLKQARYKVPVSPSANPTRDIVRKRTVPVAGVLGRMELGGVRVDRQHLHELKSKLGDVILSAEKELLDMAQRPDLKLNSARDIGDILFNKGFIHPNTGERTWYAPVTLTATGQPQTTEKVLKILIAKHKCPFSAKKGIYAKAYKAKNTFLESVDALSLEDGYVHSNFNQHGTGTYRLSSNDINLQNVPKKLAGHSIKKIFVTDDNEEFVFVNADAKGAEVRILTAYSRDQALIVSLNSGQDTHCFIASKIVEVVRLGSNADALLKEMGLNGDYPLTYEDFAARDALKVSNPPYGEMLNKFRDAVKRVVFGILYGAGAAKISDTIGISKEQAQLIIDMLFQMFPSIKTYMDQTKWELKTFGVVETYFGHRRRFSVQGAAKFLVSRAERQGVNFKIQSTSSDIVMDCLQRIEQPLVKDMGGRLLLTVHDSIGFQFPKRHLSQLGDFITQHLERDTAVQFPWLPVAFKWDYEVGPSYGELLPLPLYLEKNPVVHVRDDVSDAYTEEEIRMELADPLTE